MREKQDFLFGCVCIGLATLIFSTMEVILKLPAVEGAFHPMQITLGRFLIGGLFLLPVAAWALHRKQRKLTAKDLRAFAITGLFCVPLAMVFYQLALVSGHANVVAVIFSGNPIFVTILAFLLLRESIRWNNILALVLEVLGILAIAVLGGGGGSLLSVVLAILAALLIPALTGYIDKANAEKVVAETRMVVMAIQTESSSTYAKGVLSDTNKPSSDNIKALAEVKGLESTSSY